MKVLIHLNHDTKKSRMFDFGRNVTRKDMLKLLKRGENKAVEVLLGYGRCLSSGRKFDILAENSAHAESAADFVLRQSADRAESVL